MSSVTAPLGALFRQPLTLFDHFPHWLQPAPTSAMKRWARVLAVKPWDFLLFIGLVIVFGALGLVAAILLPLLLLSGVVSLTDLSGLVRMADSGNTFLPHLTGSGGYDIVTGGAVFILWCLSTWLPSRRSVVLSLVVMTVVLVAQASNPAQSLILAFSYALCWFMDDLFGCRPQLSKSSQVLVVLCLVGFHAGLTMAVDQSLVRSVVALLLVTSSLLATWYYFAESSRRKLLDNSQAALRAQASAAERERIGRDLHDLLGHTLSLITLKLELSRKLADSDPQRSRAEANEAETVARQALVQVRAAVSGMRATDLHGEIASAGLLLQSRGVSWQAHSPPPLPPAIDTALSLVLREAVTNIARHAEANTARLQFVVAGDVVQMIISDDGRGVGKRRGNGLTGMRERVEALDGVLSIEGEKGMGSQLTISVPLTVEAGA